MDISLHDDKLTGLNGVVEEILQAVIKDSRWVVRWVGWNTMGTERTMNIGYHNAGKLVGFIEIRMTETQLSEESVL